MNNAQFHQLMDLLSSNRLNNISTKNYEIKMREEMIKKEKENPKVKEENPKTPY